MEVSHRGAPFLAVAQKAEQDLRTLLKVPDNYKVLFLQGGGRGQFFSVPMNLAQRGDLSQHLVSGQWSQIAVSEAEKYMRAEVVAKTQSRDDRLWVPTQDNWEIDPNAAYFHYCPNETVDGIEIDWVPKSQSVPIVADMSSNILSKVIDVNDFGIIYAGAQKNLGPAGVTVVIVRDDVLQNSATELPAYLRYSVHAESNSLYNTPPVFSIYAMNLVLRWVKKQGGVKKMQELAEQKADLIYSAVSESGGFYTTPVDPKYRSLMNVVFQIADASLDSTFIEEAAKHGMVGLKGHRSVGGLRASLYNAMPVSGAEALADFMRSFATRRR